MKSLLVTALSCLIISVSIGQTMTTNEKKSDSLAENKSGDKIFSKVENEAEFPGGNSAWARYVQKSLESFNPADQGAAPGKYKVIVRFIVSKDGSVSDVMAETNYGHGMEEISVRTIKNGPKWKPALQNGKAVNAYRRQPLTFIIEEVTSGKN